MFGRILVANRGEIACRVIRTCRRLGIQSVAVFSDADSKAMHVRAADQAIAIGPAPARQSYLVIEAIIDAAQRSGAEAIHPGYGFLSENAAFAEACAAAGIVFIGPPPAAIRAMGSKSESKRLMAAAGVPLVPGYHGKDQSEAALTRAAEEIGYPLLVKASAGGGGKGMRVVLQRADLAAAIEGAGREALAAFGDGTLLVEKYLERPRHVEVQVFADSKGNTIHLNDRDCSIQRRHQKVIEEAPAPGLEVEVRRRMGEAAVAAARAVGYIGAGTIEFLFANGGFYFIEMNTRLQVEHPVTEMITGLDLVEWQLRIAAGETLPLDQNDVPSLGHAMEARLYAEDPDKGFLPAAGPIDHLKWPDSMEGIRIDTGVTGGDRIGVHYDPMIAKVIAWGAEREIAAKRLAAALAATELAGPVTNASFLGSLLRHPAFLAGEIDTGFIERHRAQLFDPQGQMPDRVLAMAAMALVLADASLAVANARSGGDPHSPWLSGDGWRLNGSGGSSVLLRANERRIDVRLTFSGRQWKAEIDGREALNAFDARLDGTEFRARIDNGTCQARAILVEDRITISENGRIWRLERENVLARAEAAATQHERILSPMPGTVVRVLVAEGVKVAKGTALIVVEAMKMEHSIVAPGDGQIGRIHFRAGEPVGEGTELMEFEAAS